MLASDWVDAITWPVLRLTRPFGIAVTYSSADQLLSARYLGLKDLNRIDSVLVVDSAGRSYLLRDPGIRGHAPTGLRAVLFRLVNPRVPICFRHVAALGVVDFAHLKEELLANVFKYPDYWSERNVGSADAFASRVREAQDLQELLGLVS